jgi:curved DNA-binding protein CbpA
MDFAKLNAADEILADPEKRRVYDEMIRRHGEGRPRLLSARYCSQCGEELPRE